MDNIRNRTIYRLHFWQMNSHAHETVQILFVRRRNTKSNVFELQQALGCEVRLKLQINV